MKTDFIVLESFFGQFLRFISSSFFEKFNVVLQRRSFREVGGYLMFLVVGSKGVENIFRVLLVSYIKEELFKLYGEVFVDRILGMFVILLYVKMYMYILKFLYMLYGLYCWNNICMMYFIFVGVFVIFQYGEVVVKFVLDCFLVFLVKSCLVLVNQVFIFLIYFENLNCEQLCFF